MRQAELERLLDLTRQVFMGNIQRADLLTCTIREKVFVGTAIMLAVPDEYFWDYRPDPMGIVVKNNYGDNLHNITQRGLYNDHAVGAQEFPSYWVWPAEQFQRAAARAELSDTAGRAPHLAPPPELLQLVNELGRTPAIDQFVRDIKLGRRQEVQWQRELEDQSDRENDALTGLTLVGSDLPPSGDFLFFTLRRAAAKRWFRARHTLPV